METKRKKSKKKREMGFKAMKEEPKKLSKIGEWFKSGQAAIKIINHKAVLK